MRLGVVGAGLVGRKHIASIRQTGGVKLGAIVDQDRTVDSWAQPSDAGSVDGIILATPNSLHVEQGLECIAAGDTFAGALLAQFARTRDAVMATRYANAAAALPTCRSGAVSSIPNRADVESFLLSNGVSVD